MRWSWNPFRRLDALPQNSTLNSRTLTSLRLQHQVRKLRKRPDKIRPSNHAARVKAAGVSRLRLPLGDRRIHSDGYIPTAADESRSMSHPSNGQERTHRLHSRHACRSHECRMREDLSTSP